MPHSLRLALLLVASVPLAAQTPTYISPNGAATSLGGTNNNIPFSWTPIAYQQVHDAASFNNTNAGVWTKMSLRMAQGYANRAGAMVDLELYLAHSPNTAANASAVFANNIVPATEINVFTRKQVNLPTAPDNNWNHIVFPFDNAFVFTGVNDISWRAIVYGNSNNNMSFTYPLDAWTGAGTYTATGTACKSANGTTSTPAFLASGLRIGANTTFYCYSYVLAGGFPAIVTLGASQTSHFGVPLPFDLGALGAPGCWIYNDILATVSGVTQANAQGSALVPLAIPNDPNLISQSFHAQALFLETGANALGMFTTQGITCTIGTPKGLTRIYGTSPTSTTGSVGGEYGLAVGFN